MTATDSIEVRQQLVIRKPVSDVFRAFADPGITTKFWFNRGTGPLASDARVTWYWDIYSVSAAVRVLEFEPDKRILIEWGSADGSDATTVEFTFEAKAEDRTLLSILNKGFAGDEDAVIATALDAMGGFSLVLAAAKAWLEHGVDLKVVEDKF